MKINLRLLVVNNLKSDNIRITEALEMFGFTLDYDCVDTAQRLKNALLVHDWEIVIVVNPLPDFCIPDPLSVCREFAPDVPVIILADVYNVEQGISFLNQGASDYLSKDQQQNLIPAIIRELKRSGISKAGCSSGKSECSGTEGSINQSIERLKKAAIVSKSGNWEYDLNTGMISGSDGAQRLYGLDNTQWNYEEIRLIPLPQYRKMLEEGLRDLANSGKPYDFEFKIRQHKTGEIIDIHSIAEYDSVRRIFFGVIQDITDRKRIEEALLKSEEKYRLLIENQGEGVATVDLNEIFVFANPAADQMFGVPKGTLVNRCLLDFMVPDQIAKIREESAKRAKLEQSSYEIEILTLKGEKSHILVTATPQTNALGEVTGTFGIFRDVTERKHSQDKLVKSERKYRELANSLPVGIFESDLTGLITFANDTLINWLEYPGNEYLVGFNMLDFILENERVKAKERFTNLIINDLQTASEYNAIRKDGSSFPVLVSVCSIKIEGIITGIRGTLTDITERKKIEEALNASDKLLSNLVEKMPDGVYKSTSEGKFVSVNPAMVAMLGYSSKEDLLAIDIKKSLYFDPDERSQLVSMKSAGGIDIFRLRKKDNSEIWVEDHGWYNFDEKRNILYHEGIIRDVSNRKRDEDKLRILSQTVEQNPASTIITDSEGNIQYVNNAFVKLTQYSPEEVMNKPPRIFNRGHIPDPDFELMWEVLRSGKFWKGEYQNRRKDKSCYWENVTISSLMNNDGIIVNFILIMEDITEKKKMLDDLILAKESAEENNRLKSAFLAMMNHELRTPLTHILGFSELIMSGVASEDNLSFASSIQSSGQNLLSIIEGVFDLALIDHTKINLSYQTFSIMDHYMENKASFDHILKTSSKHSQINLIFRPDAHWLSSYITADRGKINQVLINLFKNAVKFTNEGSIEFGFIVESETDIRFYIKDTGIGIPEEKQKVIFDYFTQVDDSYTRVYGGIGVGLAISKKITQILNGELTVNSSVGMGSTFSLTIPVELSYIKE